jgi:hypothetical protein
MKYSYRVLRVDHEGTTVVQYDHPELGTVMKTMILPHDREEAVVRRKIVEAFPLDVFYSRHLAKCDVKTFHHALRGEMEVDFDDHFYSIQEESTETM